MPVVPNGNYKIISVLYSPPSVDKKDEQVVNLLQNGPGPIAGRPDSEVHNDQWRITNVYDLPPSNSVKIESVIAPGTYAYGAPKLGNEIVGDKTNIPIIWTLVKRETADGRVVFNIQYPDKPNDDLVWELKEKNQNIKYGNYHDGTQPYNEWIFAPV